MKKQGVKKVENKRMPFVSPGVQGREPRFKPGTFTKVMSVTLLALSAILVLIWLPWHRKLERLKVAYGLGT